MVKNNMKSTPDITNITYKIENEVTTAESYQNFISALLPERYHESCEEAADGSGGDSLFQLKDRDGNFYQIVESFKHGLQMNSVRKIKK